ncbi:MAG: hypothetical protein ACXWCM_01895 [Acidimicrobiales bacterium]
MTELQFRSLREWLDAFEAPDTDEVVATLRVAIETDPLVESPWDIGTDEVVIDLRDPAPLPRRRRRRPDHTLTIVLNRVRYRTLGVDAVRATDGGPDSLTELGELVAPRNLTVLVRRAATRRPSCREARRRPDPGLGQAAAAG